MVLNKIQIPSKAQMIWRQGNISIGDIYCVTIGTSRKTQHWLNMADNSDFESVDVCTWTFLMIWMPVLRFSLAFFSWFADFKLFVSCGNFIIIMLGNQHGSTISRKDSILLCDYPLRVCKAFFVLHSYFNICLNYIKAHFVSMDNKLVHGIFCL